MTTQIGKMLQRNLKRWIAYRYSPSDNWTLGVLEEVSETVFDKKPVVVQFTISGCQHEITESECFQFLNVSEESIGEAFTTLTFYGELEWRKRRV